MRLLSKPTNLFLGACFLAAVAGFAQTFKLDSSPNPSQPGSLQPNWSVTPEGNPLLSWVEKAKDGSYSLRYAILRGSQWSEPRTVAAHRHFFRHPAEVPEVIALSGGSLLAHWVETRPESSEAEFVFLSASQDRVHWTPPLVAHKDRKPVLHGLVSMVQSGDQEASLTWLQAAEGEDSPTSLMRTVVAADGRVLKEERLDSDVCECCPTAAVRTGRGLLVAYRGHTPEEIRDIAILRLENGKWSSSKKIYPDKWQVNLCPINAASASAEGDQVVVSWYTGAPDAARVQIAFSADAGSTFSKPVVVSTGHAYGYTSVVLDEAGALVSWLEEGGGAARILARQVSSSGTMGPVSQIAQGSKLGFGYPRLLHAGHETWIAWGNSETGEKLQTGRLVK